MARSSTPVGIGILGAARIAHRAIVTPAQETGARLVAIAARNRERAEVFAAEHGIERVYDHYDDVLTDAEVEMVYIPLPNGLHGPWTLRAIAAGKHVLIEKPFASNAEEATEVRAAAADAGVLVMEAFHYYFHPVARRLRELVGEGAVGDLRQVDAVVRVAAPNDDDPRWSLALAGGALMDVGCYGLHLQRTLAGRGGGEPSVVRARSGERAGHPGVDEWLDAELTFPSGATGTVRCHMAADREEMRCRVLGSKGAVTATNFVLPQLDDRVVIETDGEKRTEHLGVRSSFTYQLEAFCAALRDGAPLPLDATDAVRSMTLVDACYRAAGLQQRPRYAN